MAAITVRRNAFLLPIKPLLSLQGFYHKFIEAGDAKPRPLSEDDYLIFKPGKINVLKWKKMDSRSLGITRTMVPASPYTVMHILRTRGFEAYLVGGCVRDLLLNRTPKDFDVITTADLNQISNQFHRCEVVGRRFPVCRVYIKGSVVEVSSFGTLAKDAEGKEKFLESLMPRGCDELDLIRWKNSMHRDFTINSLFFDPFLHKIYDYNDGMKDLLELKLRTLVPALLSFTEDSARILRGLRIAARLGLSLSKEIKSAIFKQISAIPRLGQSRITMELNYMLSFGAAESSLSLLHKYHLLEILLPFQAAYISQQATRSGQSSTMLMKLLSHLDKLVTCDRPSGSHLWIGLLGFHLALVNNPQHPFVILTFASVLYHQSWEDGLSFSRKNGQRLVSFDPETVEPFEFISDDEIAEKVNQLAMLVVDSIDVLVETDSLSKTMEMFSGTPYPGLVFIPQKMGHYTKQLFNVLAHKVETYKRGRASFEINYDLLGKGDSLETRFALGKIILNTMGCEVNSDLHHDSDPNAVNHHAPSSPKDKNLMNKKEDINQPPLSSKLDMQLDSAPKKQNFMAKLSSIMHQRPGKIKYNVQQNDSQERMFTKHTEVVGVSSDPKYEDHVIDKSQIDASKSPTQEPLCVLETVVDNIKSPFQFEIQNLEGRLGENTEVKVDHSVVENDEAGVNFFLWSVKTNCKRAIEEARDSHAELGKLNRFLVSFVEEQVQRKKGKKHLETSSFMSSSIDISQTEANSSVTSISNHQIESEQSEASIGTSESDSNQLESSSSVASSVVTSQMESVPHPQGPKATRSKRITRASLSTNGEKKKQRVCSYCKEAGHNKTGCPKGKVEEALCRV